MRLMECQLLSLLRLMLSRLAEQNSGLMPSGGDWGSSVSEGHQEYLLELATTIYYIIIVS